MFDFVGGVVWLFLVILLWVGVEKRIAEIVDLEPLHDKLDDLDSKLKLDAFDSKLQLQALDRKLDELLSR